MIKKLSLAAYKKLIRSLSKSHKPIDLIIINEKGQIEGTFYVKEQGHYYLIKAVRDLSINEVTILVNKIEGRKGKTDIVRAEDFYITKNSVMEYLRKNYFNS